MRTTAAHLIDVLDDPVTRWIGCTNHPRGVGDALTGGQHVAINEFPNHSVADAALRGGAVHGEPAFGGGLRGSVHGDAFACSPGRISKRTVATRGIPFARSGTTAWRTMITEPAKPCSHSSR